jgi:putative spermidine/putrescine transport system substrate-binding protein
MRFLLYGERAPSRLMVAAVAVFAALMVAACGSSSSTKRNTHMLQSIGKGEGQLNLIEWPGYVEPQWVKPFEQQTGCQVHNKDAGTSDQMVLLMRTGQYDGVSASGNATERLVDAGDVSPVNVKLVPNYATIFPDIKNQPYNTFGGVHYGIPHGRGANLLMWRTDRVKPAPLSWSSILDPAQAAKYKGKISAYDDPIYIADAAVYLKSHDPGMEITNPYELDSKQFGAAVKLLQQQRPYVGEYWSDATKQIQAYASGDDLVGTTWQYQYFQLKGKHVPVAISPASEGFVPTEGATGWSDTWMISSKAKHPNCMYKWFNWIVSPMVNAEVAQYFGEAPAQSLACQSQTLTAAAKVIGYPPDPNFCNEYHAGLPPFWQRVYYWRTPTSNCGDSRGNVCKNYNDWVSAWTQIKG